MSDTLYLQLDQNIQVTHPHIYLQDVAKLSCSNSKILNRLRVMPVANLAPDKPGRYVMSVMDLITEIQKKEPDLEITTIGEPNFIITFKNKPGPGLVWQWCKIIFVGVSSFKLCTAARASATCSLCTGSNEPPNTPILIFLRSPCLTYYHYTTYFYFFQV